MKWAPLEYSDFLRIYQFSFSHKRFYSIWRAECTISINKDKTHLQKHFVFKLQLNVYEDLNQLILHKFYDLISQFRLHKYSCSVFVTLLWNLFHLINNLKLKKWIHNPILQGENVIYWLQNIISHCAISYHTTPYQIKYFHFNRTYKSQKI